MTRQLLLDVLAVPAPSLANYIAGPNGEALAAARALAAGRAIYLWGPAGCGRSHLLRALAAEPGSIFVDAGSDAGALRALAEAEPDVLMDVPHAQDAGSPAAALPDSPHARDADSLPATLPRLVAVDDVHRMDRDQQAALFALYNRWRETTATSRAFVLAVSGDRAPMSMPLREDLRTRLGWDLVFRLEPLSDADKLAALAAQAAERGLQLGPEVVNWMLTHHERDIRKLAALLDALDRYSLATGRPITIPLLRAMLADPDSQAT